MPTDWYLTQPSTLGGFEENEFWTWRTTFANDILPSFAATDVQNYHDKITNTSDNFRAVIQNVTTNSYNTMQYRQILAEIGKLHNGDLILNNNRWWIIIGQVDNQKVYEKAVMYYCNVLLNFTSPETLETVTYPCYVHNATQYNSGERYTDYMLTPSSQRLIYLPYNSETIKIDNGYRFMIDRNTDAPSVWRTAQMDSENDFWGERGVVRLMVVEDEHSTRDDDVAFVADNEKWLNDHGYKNTAVPGGGWIDM